MRRKITLIVILILFISAIVSGIIWSIAPQLFLQSTDESHDSMLPEVQRIKYHVLEGQIEHTYNNHGEYNNFLYYAQTLSEVKSRTGNGFSVITKDNLSAELENELSNTKTILNMISVLLCVISGISIMSITFFSVKERIPEIGIRKAFGAGKSI